jgi:hypothetical protein
MRFVAHSIRPKVYTRCQADLDISDWIFADWDHVAIICKPHRPRRARCITKDLLGFPSSYFVPFVFSRPRAGSKLVSRQKIAQGMLGRFGDADAGRNLNLSGMKAVVTDP